MKRSHLLVSLMLTMLLCRAALAQTASGNLNIGLPEGWRAQQTQEGVVLVPPDLNPEESYLLMIAGAPLEASIRDPQVAQAVLARTMSQFQGFELLATPAECNVAGDSGMKLVLGAVDRATGRKLLVCAWVTIERGRTIMLIAHGTVEHVLPRVQVMDGIAANVRFNVDAAQQQQQQQPQQPVNANVDPMLVGAWQTANSSSYVSARHGGGFSADYASTTVMRLLPDGRGVSTVQSQMAASGYGERAPSSGGNNYPFTWAGRGGRIVMQLPGQPATEMRYEVSRDTLIVYGPKGERTIYRRVG